MKLKNLFHFVRSSGKASLSLTFVFMLSSVVSVSSACTQRLRVRERECRAWQIVLFRYHLNFNDPIEISARMIPMIQNRTMTFDSGHPICSK
jgi:hypothetical protein